MTVRGFTLFGLCCALTLAGTARVRAATFTEVSASALSGFNVDARSASLADIDGDGDLDLFFQGASGAVRLFRNQWVELGSLSFTVLPTPSGIGPSWSACWGDYDGDGDVDVFVGQSNIGASGDLLQNDGTGTFTNVSVATGLNDPGFHQNVAWCDIDNDQDLDLIIGMEGPELHEIYLQGPGTLFTPVGAQVGFQQPFGTKAYGMAIGDTDGDGDRDIYLSTCRGDNNIRNNFYENQLVDAGSLGFIDIADSNGTQFFQNSYHAEFADFDDDGDLDLFMVGADSQLTKIFRNDGGNQFTDVDTITGHALLDNLGGDYDGGRAIDYDHDGDLDLFFHDHRPGSGKDQARRLYRNDGNWVFTDVTVAAGIDAACEGAYDSAWGDIDLDGDMDLIAPTDSGFVERVFLNDASASGFHWLQVRLVGPVENTTGIGAALYATTNLGLPGEHTLRRDANPNAGTFNQSDLPVHFGLGTASTIDKLRIEWPDGRIQQLCNVPTDQYLTIHYPIPGDFNGDGYADSVDIVAFADCLGGPGQPVSPSASACDDACGMLDADFDNDVDLADFMSLAEALGN